jgi:hypothetical protein
MALKKSSANSGLFRYPSCPLLTEIVLAASRDRQARCLSMSAAQVDLLDTVIAP